MGSTFRLLYVLLLALTLAACGGGGGGGGTDATTVAVTASGDNLVIVPVSSAPISAGSAASFTVTANAGYTRRVAVDGTCASGSYAGDVYTTGPVTADCTVIFWATRNAYSVTPSGSHVTVDPSTLQSVLSGDTAAFAIAADAGYTVDMAVGGSCPAGSFLGATYTTGAINSNCTVSFSATANPSLAVSVATLALRVSGAARTVTITNTGGLAAIGVSHTVALPPGTVISPASCGDIAPAGSCVLTITPGAIPTAEPGNTNPPALVMSIAGSNTNTVTTDLHILGYGSVYQSGYLFAIDDTTVATGGIGGKVLALEDQAAPYPNGIPWADSAVVIAGIAETAVAPPDACTASVNGACASQVIVAANSPPERVPGVVPTTYAAGLCTATIGGRDDWYLPAICELSYAGNGASSGCGSAVSPATDNVQGSLVDSGALVAGSAYWSSTQASIAPETHAWVSFLAAGGGGLQSIQGRGELVGVRCVRAVTP